jgi:hypothetical protein
MTRKDFIEALFDIDDLVAWGKNDAYCAYPKSPWPEMLHTDAVKFCINPLKGKRNGKNVTHINCLLFEMDKEPTTGRIIPPKEQLCMWEDSGLPFTTMTWSGTKSMHVIVRLEKPVPEKWFRPLWQAIYRVLIKKGMPIDDATMKIPQISRLPLSYRSGKLQRLIRVNERVKYLDLINWLKLNGETIIAPKPVKPFVPTNIDEPVTHRFERAIKWTKQSQKSEYSSYWKTGGDNWLFVLGCNLSKLGVSLDQAISLVTMKWGTTYETSAGTRDISIPISKGHKRNN